MNNCDLKKCLIIFQKLTDYENSDQSNDSEFHIVIVLKKKQKDMKTNGKHPFFYCHKNILSCSTQRFM